MQYACRLHFPTLLFEHNKNSTLIKCCVYCVQSYIVLENIICTASFATHVQFCLNWCLRLAIIKFYLRFFFYYNLQSFNCISLKLDKSFVCPLLDFAKFIMQPFKSLIQDSFMNRQNVNVFITLFFNDWKIFKYWQFCKLVKSSKGSQLFTQLHNTYVTVFITKHYR